MPEQQNITSFEDLKFQPKLSNPMGAIYGFDASGIQAKVEFDNGYGASVIGGGGAYGGDKGLYELAVLRGDSICYDTPITSDVEGHLSPDDVSALLVRISELPGGAK